MKWPAYLSPINLNSVTPESLAALINGRKLYLRGAAFLGQNLACGLKRHGFKIEAFADKSPRLWDRTLQGIKVLKPEEILKPGAERDIFVITCSGYTDDDMRAELTDLGFTENRDFISFTNFLPLHPSVDIAGICNLHCLGCPRGNMSEHPPKGFMSAEVYEKVLMKLLRELPFLGAIQLYTWGEPLLNKDLLEIIAINKKHGVMSIISTNLSLKADLEAFVKAEPELVRISCSGYDKNYEMTHTGASWDLYLENVKTISRLNRELGNPMEVELYYHLYQHNTNSDYEKIKALSAELDFAFRPVLASLYPRENIFLLREGQELSACAQKQLSLLTEEARSILTGEACIEENSVCLDNRCFSINWDLKVRVCGVTYLAMLDDNFLKTPLPEIIEKMAVNETCKRCVKNKAHSFIKPFMADQRIALEASHD